MKLLLDQNLSFKLVHRLGDLCEEIVHVRAVSLEEGADSQIWSFAKTGGYVIVTMDSDFAELASLFGSPPSVVWLRCGNQPTTIVEHRIRGAWAAILALLESDASVLEIY